MFDKMHLRPAANLELKKLLELGSKISPGDSQYRKTLRLDMGEGKTIAIRVDPYYPSALPSIEFNPSKFNHWSELESALSLFTSLKNLTIDRLDHAVDVKAPFLDVRSKIRIKRKQTACSYSQIEARKGVIREGIKMGEKPEVYCIYDKGCEVTSRYRFKPIPGVKLGINTRVEVRQFNKKVTFPNLLDLRKYINHDPFENLVTFEVDDSCQDKLKLEDIKRDLRLISFDELYVSKNLNGNFFRTYGRCFKRSNLSDQIRDDYQSKIRSFII